MLTASVFEKRPWLWALAFAWLALLGPFFFLTYGYANTVASHRAYVPWFAFGWEHWIPFLPWTIVPYWTSDLLYGLSLLVCTTRRELTMQVKRLVAAQVVSVSFFLALPLRCTFERPAMHGFFGWLFDVLLGFDKPFNQAPSLHVSLALILWSRFSAHLDGVWRIAMGGWLVLVALSTLTTFQHHFIDLPTGALAGLLVIALFPEERRVMVDLRRAQRLRLATFYTSGAVVAGAIALSVGGWTRVLYWLAAALLVVACAYVTNSPRLFRHPIIRLIAAPYTAAAWINSRWWTRNQPEAQEIADGVWLGRAPIRSTNFRSIVNLAAELRVDGLEVPVLDLVEPTEQQQRQAINAIEEFASQRPTLVCCALGFSRSASAVAGWMAATGRSRSRAEAIAIIREKRPQVVVAVRCPSPRSRAEVPQPVQTR